MDLNISKGTLSIYRNGEKATISINPAETFRQLQNRIHEAGAAAGSSFGWKAARCSVCRDCWRKAYTDPRSYHCG